MNDKLIYDVLDKFEKVAIKFAKINSIIKKDRKKRIKKDKKLGKLNKKSGVFVLKKLKKQKGAKFHKRNNATNN